MPGPKDVSTVAPRQSQLMPLLGVLGVLGVVVAIIAVLIYAFHKSSKPPYDESVSVKTITLVPNSVTKLGGYVCPGGGRLVINSAEVAIPGTSAVDMTGDLQKSFDTGNGDKVTFDSSAGGTVTIKMHCVKPLTG